jgi:calcineurin-like phosphoesterase family protein
MNFKQTEDQRVYFSADPHYGHKNICGGSTSWGKDPHDPQSVAFSVKYKQFTNSATNRARFCKDHGLRDFESVEEMNDAIVDRFNEKVRENDIIFILGDIAFGGHENVGKFMRRLRCQNRHLVYGNHDKPIEMNRDGLQGFFKSCEYKRYIHVDGQYIMLDHFAHRIWDKSHHGAWHLYGHSHSKLEHLPWGKSMDVGVDTHDMYPYSFEEIKEILDKREVLTIDHHEKRS